LIHLLAENRFIRADQDDFWLYQPKVMNLIASKVVEQLNGFFRTHVALSRCAARCGASGKRRNDADGPIFPTRTGNSMLIALIKGPDDFALWRRWLALVVSNTTARNPPSQRPKSPRSNDPS